MESIQTLKFALSFVAIFCGFVIAAFWVYTTVLGRKRNGFSSPTAPNGE